MGNVYVVEENGSVVRFDKPNDHVKGGRFSGSIWAEKANDLARGYLKGESIDHTSVPI